MNHGSLKMFQGHSRIVTVECEVVKTKIGFFKDLVNQIGYIKNIRVRDTISLPDYIDKYSVKKTAQHPPIILLKSIIVFDCPLNKLTALNHTFKSISCIKLNGVIEESDLISVVENNE